MPSREPKGHFRLRLLVGTQWPCTDTDQKSNNMAWTASSCRKHERLLAVLRGADNGAEGPWGRYGEVFRLANSQLRYMPSPTAPLSTDPCSYQISS